jgi:hypothetical protein
MKTNNTEGLSIFEINVLIQQGAKFVKFPYMNKFRNSNIYFIRPGENSFKYAVKHLFLNIKNGWKASPMIPVYILKSLFFLVIGGIDYTQAILNDLRQNNPECNPEIQSLQYI